MLCDTQENVRFLTLARGGGRARCLTGFTAPTLILPRLSRYVPSMRSKAAVPTLRIQKALCRLLVDNGVMQAFDTKQSLCLNIQAALKEWCRQRGYLNEVGFLNYHLYVGDWGLDRTEPLIAFSIERDTDDDPPCLFLAGVLNKLHSMHPCLPQGLLNVIRNLSRGIEAFDFDFLYDYCERSYWFGYHEQEEVIEQYRSENEKESDPVAEGCLLPDEFHQSYPRWLFPYVEVHDSVETVWEEFLTRECDGTWQDVVVAIRAAERLGPLQRDDLITDLYGTFCENGECLSPLFYMRMDDGDIAPRIYDDHEREALEVGTITSCGGYVAYANDKKDMEVTWRKTVALLDRLQALNQILSSLRVISEE